MANHCDNTIEIYLPKDSEMRNKIAQAFRKATEDDYDYEKDYPLQKILPLPELPLVDKVKYALQGRLKQKLDNHFERFYGYTRWIDVCDVSDDEECLYISFVTAWRPCNEFFEKLYHEYDVHYTYYYIEPGCGVFGISENGVDECWDVGTTNPESAKESGIPQRYIDMFESYFDCSGEEEETEVENEAG